MLASARSLECSIDSTFQAPVTFFNLLFTRHSLHSHQNNRLSVSASFSPASFGVFEAISLLFPSISAKFITGGSRFLWNQVAHVE